MKEPKRYYSLVENKESDFADLYIFGDISTFGQWWEDDPDRSAYNIVNELKAVTASNINVHINSYGGDVSEGLAIYNTLRSSGKNVTTICDGFACSAASVVFMAGSKRVMSPASLLMIHNAWTVAMGNSEELRTQADDLETITQASVEAYKLVATISEEEIKELMDNETWILPEDAKAYGFATDIDDEDEEDKKEPRQSAFRLIMDKLTAEPVKVACLAVDDFADMVAETVLAVMETKKQGVNVPEQPTVPEMPEDKNGWKEFFRR